MSSQEKTFRQIHKVGHNKDILFVTTKYLDALLSIKVETSNQDVVTPALSKHLRGQLDPPVGNGHVFWTKEGQLDPPVGNGHVFWTKGGHLDPPVGNLHVFWTKGGQLDPPVGNGHVFWTKGGQLDPPVSDVTFFGPKEISWTGGTVP